MFSKSVSFLMFTLLSFVLVSQKEQLVNVDVKTTHAVFLGKTKPIRESVYKEPISPFKRQQTKKNNGKFVPNFFNRELFEKYRENTLPKDGADPAWVEPGQNKSFQVEPLLNIEGVDESVSNVGPPDPDGDIGKNHFVQMVNATYFQVFNKDGSEASIPISSNTIWNQVGHSSAGDPIIIYDQEAEKWLLTEFAAAGNNLLIALSENSDPLGAWNAYSFSTPNFPDYPKYSIWENAYVVTTNEGGQNTQPIYFIHREELLNLNLNPTIQRIEIPGVSGGPSFQAATPVDWTGLNAPPSGSLPMVIRYNDDEFGASEDRVELFEFDIDWDNSSNTTVTQLNMPTEPFESFPCAAMGGGFACVPQLNGGGIDGLPEIIMNQVHYRHFNSHEAMVCCFLVDVMPGNNYAGIRWIEFRRTTGDWYIYQEGTYGTTDDIHRFMGSICMDVKGNIALAYSYSGPNIYAGLAFTGRKASDPLGEMTVPEYDITPGFSVNNSSRYGDYACLNVDPTNGKTFWYTGEYRGNLGWGTKIVAFELASDTIDMGPIEIESPLTSSNLSASEPLTVKVKNYGLDTITSFDIGFTLNANAPFTESVITSLYPDSIYTHTFSSILDMLELGEYELAVFTTLAGDSNIFNDTLKSVIHHLREYDIGLDTILTNTSLLCTEDVDFSFLISNYGASTIDSFMVGVVLNGTLQSPFLWTLQTGLAYGESTTVNYELSNFQDGPNVLEVYTYVPNNVQDEYTINDTSSFTFYYNTNTTIVTLELTTDEYSDETSWELTNTSDQVLYSGGPYQQDNSLISVVFCLELDSCYTFTIYDSYGDGICCGFGNGTYQIKDENGETIASMLSNNFGFSESNYFCLKDDTCMVFANISVTNPSGSNTEDGAIYLEPIAGLAPFQFSIDGGNSFTSNQLFDNLDDGTYSIVVEDANGCPFMDTVMLDYTTETAFSSNGLSDIRIAPNPTRDVISILTPNFGLSDVYLNFNLLDAKGSVLHTRNLTLYDASYRGMLNLYHYPEGIYYLQFDHPTIKKMIPVVKY